MNRRGKIVRNDDVHDYATIHFTKFSDTNLRASRGRVSRVKVNNQRLLGGRTLESLSVLVLKSKVRSSLSNLEVKSGVLSGGGGRSESRGRSACDGGDDGRGLHVYVLMSVDVYEKYL